MKNNENWFRLLIEGHDREGISIERLNAIADKDGYEVLEYVLNTLDVLDNLAEFDYKKEVREALKWCEVAKGGSATRVVDEWYMFNLAVHNIGSSQIYNEYCDKYVRKHGHEKDQHRWLIFSFIRIHGIIGQYLRGEVSTKELDCLRQFIIDAKNYGYATSKIVHAVTMLTRCVIAGISDDLWESVERGAMCAINTLADQKIPDNDAATRLRRMLPGFNTDVKGWKYEDAFDKYTFWYPEVALNMFSDDIRLRILEAAMAIAEQHEDISDISFKNIANEIYYDFKGNKCVNVYKKRMIEAYVCGNQVSEHLRFCIDVADEKVLNIGLTMSPEARAMVDFFVQAEACNNVKYHQAIPCLCDLLGLRKDSFDRLGNEDSYLGTMNDISGSRKGEILDYVVGESVVDVGSGSGILLDELEKRFPDMSIIGTDISQEVIDRLNKRASAENHNWNVRRHDFTSGRFHDTGNPCDVDTIIFSSILHEIFSFASPRYNLMTVKMALMNAYRSLKPGGRIIIRDGVKTGTNQRVILNMNKEDKSFWKSFVQDFKGLPDYDRNDIVEDEDDLGFFVTADIDYIREFLFTFTWGPDSYPQEVQEQFGYMTLSEIKSFAIEMGAKIIKAEGYLEPGYTDNLIRKQEMRLADELDDEISLPNSNMIVVIEKPRKVEKPAQVSVEQYDY